MAKCLARLTPDRKVWVRALAGTLLSECLSPPGITIKWVQVNCQGNPAKYCGEVGGGG